MTLALPPLNVEVELVWAEPTGARSPLQAGKTYVGYMWTMKESKQELWIYHVELPDGTQQARQARAKPIRWRYIHDLGQS